VVRDTIELREEGLPIRLVSIAAGSDTVEAEIDCGRVWRISLTQSRLRTPDSLDVGVSLARLLPLPGVDGIAGEKALHVIPLSRCGLSLRLTDPQEGAPAPDSTAAAPRHLPPSSVVTEVLIFGYQSAV